MSGMNDIAKEVGLNPIKDTENGVTVDTTKVLEDFFTAILSHCKDGETVRVKNFGTFTAKLYKGRTLKSPLLEGGSVDFPDQLVLRFRQAGAAKRALNVDEPKKGKKGKKGKKKSAPKKSTKSADKKSTKSADKKPKKSASKKKSKKSTES